MEKSRRLSQNQVWRWLLHGCLGASLFGMALWIGCRPISPQQPSPVFLSTVQVDPTSSTTPSPTATELPTATPTIQPTATPTSLPTATTIPATPTMTPTMTATPRPLPTPDGIARALRVPILMYHYISEPPDGADAVRRDLSVAPTQFEEHLRFLQQAGYTSISLRDLALALQIGYPLPLKPIIITLDDGYRDHYENAFPLLQHYHFSATLFLLTSPIDQGQPDYVTWEQVIEMNAAGMEIGAHGYTHADLRERTVDYLVWQTLGSKEAIEARLHEPVRFFCYPSGKYDDLAMRVLHSANYWGAVTVEMGDTHHSDDMFRLQRVRVHGRYSAQDLAQVLAWVASEGEQLP